MPRLLDTKCNTQYIWWVSYSYYAEKCNNVLLYIITKLYVLFLQKICFPFFDYIKLY